jgi:protease IV
VVGPIVAFGMLFILLIGVASVIVAAAGEPTVASDRSVGPTKHLGGDDGADEVVLVVPVRGPITANSSGGGLFGGLVTSGYDTKKHLQRAARDRSVRAVVLELSTPGGSVSGSQAIADGLLAVKEAGKPVYAHVTEISASGGVWSMVPADQVFADEGSLIGSIGVLFGPFRQYTGVVAVDDGILGGGVETTGGVDEFYITGGTGKDVGNPYRPLTEAERARLQTLIDTTYDRFVEHVAGYRPLLPAARIRTELGAQLYEASEAVDIGLIDGVGPREQTWDEAAKAAGLERFDVREIDESTGFLDALFGADAKTPARADLSGLCGTGAGVVAFYGDLSGTCAAWRE